MAAIGNGDFSIDPDALQRAINQLLSVQPQIQNCHDTTVGHKNWAEDVISTIRNDIESIFREIQGAVSWVWNEAQEAERAISRIAWELGGPIAGRFQPLTSELSNGLGNLGHALWCLENPMYLLSHPWELPDALSNAIQCFQNALDHLRSIVAWIRQVLAQLDAMVQEAARQGASAAKNLMPATISKVAQIVQDGLTSGDTIKSIRGIEDVLSSRRLFVNAVLEDIVEYASKGFSLAEAFSASIISDNGLYAIGETAIGNVAGLILSLPADIAFASRFPQAFYWLGSRLFPAYSSAYLNISKDWGGVVTEADKVAGGTIDLAKAFLNAHGLLILTAAPLVIAGIALTVATGGLDLAAMPVIGAIVGTSLSLVPWATAAVTVVAPADIMLAHPNEIGGDLSAARDDYAHTPAMLRNLVHAGVQTVTAPGPLNPVLDTSSPQFMLYRDMFNVAKTFAGRISR